jgi:hypothetical protein
LNKAHAEKHNTKLDPIAVCDWLCFMQVAGLRSNLWPGASCACQGSRFTNIYVGWGIKNAPFVPLPPPPVSREYDAALVESAELPPKPKPEGDGEGQDE